MEDLSEHHQELLIGKLAGTLTEEETFELDALLRDSSEIRLAFENMQHAFPADLSHNNFEKLDQAGYWRDLTAEIRSRNAKAGRVILMRRLAIAAVVLGLAFTGWFLFEKQSSQNTATRQTATVKPTVQLKLADGKIIDLSKEKGQIVQQGAKLINENNALQYSTTDNVASGINSVIVPVGMDYKITLEDGSMVWMNSLTQLDFPFRFPGDKREITLTGEAYLEIAKDAKRPFLVHLPGGTVSVLGTEFNVNTYDSGTIKVALVEGKVNVSGGNQSVALTPGNLAIYSHNSGSPISTQKFEAKKVLSWRKGLYYFDDASLDEIGKVLNRWYGVRVQIDNPALRQKRFAGILDRNKPLQVFLDDLKGMSRIASFVDDKGVLHFK